MPEPSVSFRHIIPMSADDLRPEAPTPPRHGWLRSVLLMAVPLAITWWVAFLVTGLLWWSATAEAQPQVSPPDPPHLEVVDGGSIDLERWARAHPRWTP